MRLANRLLLVIQLIDPGPLCLVNFVSFICSSTSDHSDVGTKGAGSREGDDELLPSPGNVVDIVEGFSQRYTED